MAVISPGTPVPPFRLTREDRSPFTEADLVGVTVFAFYPFAFSPVCTDQLNLYEEVREDLRAHGATMYGVSVDNLWSQRAFKERLGITFEQLSDFEPKGAVAEAFGVLNPGGFAERALVVIGPDRVVRWSHRSPSIDEIPGANLLFDALAA